MSAVMFVINFFSGSSGLVLYASVYQALLVSTAACLRTLDGLSSAEERTDATTALTANKYLFASSKLF